MNVNVQSMKILFPFIFISSVSIAAPMSEDNACFYSNDNYTEKGGGSKFCVPYYTEDEWIFIQWNNNISSISVPPNMRVDIFSDFSFTGKSASLYKNTNSDDLARYGLQSDISSYRVLPRNLYADNKRVAFSYNSALFPEKHFSYNYHLTRGNGISLIKQDQVVGMDGESSYIFYSHAGQIMTAFIGQGFDRNLYCLSPVKMRPNRSDIDVAFTYCDFNNSGQNWIPKKLKSKMVLINYGTGTALSLDRNGFYVSLHNDDNNRPRNSLSGRDDNGGYDSNEPIINVNKYTLWFDENKIKALQTNAVRPFLQYKETLKSMGEGGSRDVIVHHLEKLDDTYLYLAGEDNGKKKNFYYNAETKMLLAHNKKNNDKQLFESSCLSLLNNGTNRYSSISLTYNRSAYSDNTLEYRCDNGVTYNLATKKWYFMVDGDYHYLVNGNENKALRFQVNDKPQSKNFRGVLTGPQLGERVGLVVNFDERKPQDAIFVNNPALKYILAVDKGVCQQSTISDGNSDSCAVLNTTWSSTDDKVQNVNISRSYIPWILAQISDHLSVHHEDDDLHAYREQIDGLQTSFSHDKNQPASYEMLEQTKVLLVAFLQNYHPTEQAKIWHQVAYVLNKIDILIDRGGDAS